VISLGEKLYIKNGDKELVFDDLNDVSLNYMRPMVESSREIYEYRKFRNETPEGICILFFTLFASCIFCVCLLSFLYLMGCIP